MGLIVNQRSQDVSFADLLTQLGLADEEAEQTAASAFHDQAVLNGGPSRPSAGSCSHQRLLRGGATL